MGRLGLRIAELQHLREEWIDWDRGVLQIPERDPCACGRCWLQAYDQWGRNGLREVKNKSEWSGPSTWKDCISEQRKKIIEKADCCTPETLKQIVIEEQFGAKYDKSARTIPFGWSERLTCVLMTFFDRYDALDYSQNHINNIIGKAAENAEDINEQDFSAHNLRATGVTFLADTSVDVKMLCDLAGWEDIQTAVKYLRQSGRITTYKMYHVMGRGDWAPSVVPGESEGKFPVVMNPIPFCNEPIEPIGPDGTTYDQKCRQERANERRSEKLKVRHHREVNIPENRTAFPSKVELDFQISEMDIPGHIDPESDHYDTDSGIVETHATTLSQFAGTHTVSNPRKDREKQRRKTTLQESAGNYREDTNDTLLSSIPGTQAVLPFMYSLQRAKDRLALESEEVLQSEGGPRSIREMVAGSAVATLTLIMIGITMASHGIFLNPVTGEVGTPPLQTVGLIFGGSLAAVNILWTDYCCRVADQGPWPRLKSVLQRVEERLLC